MKALVKAVFAFFCGISATNASFFVATEALGFSGGPTYGPLVAIICISVGLSVAGLFFASSDGIFDLLEVHGDVTKSFQGRLLIVILLGFCGVFAILASYDVNAFRYGMFVPVAALGFLWLRRWVINGGRNRA